MIIKKQQPNKLQKSISLFKQNQKVSKKKIDQQKLKFKAKRHQKFLNKIRQYGKKKIILKEQPKVKMLSKQKKIPLNIKYFKSLDGIYGSYWLGKFSNFFIRKGKKRLILKQIYKTLLQLKFSHKIMPIFHILEIIERIKPSFKLINRFKRKKGGQIISYPKAVKKKKQYNVALN
jgi:hypothetical protein